MNEAAPILIGYDGSDTARGAVREAANLFGSRKVLVLTVWEPSLRYAPGAEVPGSGIEPLPTVDPEVTKEIDDTLQARGERTAKDGAELAKSLDSKPSRSSWPMRD